MDNRIWDIQPLAHFNKIAPVWQEINDQYYKSPLLDIKFITPLINLFMTGDEKIALEWKNDAINTILIIEEKKHGLYQVKQPLNSPLGLIITREKIIDPHHYKALISHHLNGGRMLGLSQIDPLFSELNIDKTIQKIPYIDTAYIDFDEPFETYWSKRSKNLKHNIKRQKNYLQKHNISTRLEVISSADTIEDTVNDYASLESAGWKGKTKTSVKINDLQSKFYKDILKSFMKEKKAHILRYYYDEKLVATDLCLIDNQCLYILKTTYDENIKGTSPAHLMRYDYLAKSVNDKHVQRVEFYGAIKDWHQRWMTGKRTLYHVNIYSHPLYKKIHRLIQNLKTN